jgi:TRAP-type C4-dicarboxylate transport system permease small subunit
MSTLNDEAARPDRFTRLAENALAACLGVMATAVFINVVLRYGFGSGIAASEELSRLLFVWMVFIGATAAYPAGEHMAFTGLVGLLKDRPALFGAATLLIRLLVLLGCVLLAWAPGSRWWWAWTATRWYWVTQWRCCRCRPCCARWPSAPWRWWRSFDASR